MNRRIAAAAWIAGAALVLGVVGVVLVHSAMRSRCADETIQVGSSSTRTHTARLIRRDCGATTSETTLLFVDSKPNPGRGEHPTLAAVSADTAVFKWESDTQLEVTLRGGRITKADSAVGNVAIRVVQP